MAAIWKIGTDAQTASQAATLEDLGITDLKIKFANRADDVATWTCEGKDMDSEPSFVYGTRIKIWQGGDVVFRGEVTSLPRHGTGTGQRRSFEARGGWYWFTKGFYTQSYQVLEWAAQEESRQVGPHSKTRVILGYGASGPCTAAAQLGDILSQAASAGAPVAAGTVSLDSGAQGSTGNDLVLPADEQVDLTWADAITRILRWFPDAIVYFRYGTASTCHIKRSGNLGNTYGLIDPVEISLTPRHDLVVPGVQIDYEITSAKSNKEYRAVKTDTAGNPSALGAAHFTVQLDGGSVSQLWQSVTTEDLPETLPTNAEGASSYTISSPWSNFFSQYIPELRGHTITAFSVLQPDSGLSQNTWPPKIPSTPGHTVDAPRILKRGEVQPWMANRGYYASSVRLRFTVSYSDADSSWDSREFHVTLPLTNAKTGIVNFLQSRTAAEDVPSGLAAELYAAAGRLWWEGSATEEKDDVNTTVFRVGQTVWIAGATHAGTETSGVDAIVQSAEWDVGRGRSTIAFGPPQHVGLQDLVELARANRRRRPVVSQQFKASADTADTAQNVIGGQGPNSNGGSVSGNKLLRRKMQASVNEHTTDGQQQSETSVSKEITIDLESPQTDAQHPANPATIGDKTYIAPGRISLHDGGGYIDIGGPDSTNLEYGDGYHLLHDSGHTLTGERTLRGFKLHLTLATTKIAVKGGVIKQAGSSGVTVNSDSIDIGL